MERRELLKMIAVLTGSAVIGGSAFLTGCKPEKRSTGNHLFSKEDVDFLDEVADTILPPTNSPGAKAAKVGSFMAVMVNDCYEQRDQKAFYEGIEKLNIACRKMHGTTFIKAAPQQRFQLLVALDKEAKDYQAKKGSMEEAERKKDKAFAGLPNHYFTMMKQLTLMGYFTSEAGCKQALRYSAVPGRYEGSVPYKKGDKLWAT